MHSALSYAAIIVALALQFAVDVTSHSEATHAQWCQLKRIYSVKAALVLQLFDKPYAS